MPHLRPPFPSRFTGKQHQPLQNPIGTPENHTKGLKMLPTSEQFCTKWRSDPFGHPCNVLFSNLALRHIHPHEPYTDPMEYCKEWYKTHKISSDTVEVGSCAMWKGLMGYLANKKIIRHQWLFVKHSFVHGIRISAASWSSALKKQGKNFTKIKTRKFFCTLCILCQSASWHTSPNCFISGSSKVIFKDDLWKQIKQPTPGLTVIYWKSVHTNNCNTHICTEGLVIESDSMPVSSDQNNSACCWMRDFNADLQDRPAVLLLGQWTC